ncbi:MAG: PIN domain-containing protein [Bifidobacteriaceae bacterium]|nr:PIN domain-containing protein [Bifidobacteriaceae bacterium]
MSGAALLDVNVLLALFDSTHMAHAQTARWLLGNLTRWATCAVTENGFARIRANPSYPSPIPVARSLAQLERARQSAEHEFWPCDVSLADPATVDRSRLLTGSATTDVYLLALAVRHNGRLVTLDQRITPEAVPGALPEHLVVLRAGG